MGDVLEEAVISPRKFALEECVFEVVCHEEDMPPSGAGMAPDFVSDVYRMVDKHGRWGWCQVEVVARVRGVPELKRFAGTAWLGQCCYKDEADFKDEGGYYEDMCAEACEDLNKNIAYAYADSVALARSLRQGV